MLCKFLSLNLFKKDYSAYKATNSHLTISSRILLGWVPKQSWMVIIGKSLGLSTVLLMILATWLASRECEV